MFWFWRCLPPLVTIYLSFTVSFRKNIEVTVLTVIIAEVNRYRTAVFMKNTISDPLKFASLVAHQLKGPIASISTILQTLLGEFAGPVTPKQKDLLQRAIGRCDESLLAAQRLLAISRAVSDPHSFKGHVELASIVRKSSVEYTRQASQHNITLTTKIDAEPALVVGTEAAMTEILEALLSNAVKYTPDNGRIEVLLLYNEPANAYQMRIADSGIGISEENYEKIFQPFFRTPVPAIHPVPAQVWALHL